PHAPAAVRARPQRAQRDRPGAVASGQPPVRARRPAHARRADDDRTAGHPEEQHLRGRTDPSERREREGVSMTTRRPIIAGIVGGLLGFHTPVMRQFYDLKVYLAPPEDLRRVWKVRRDTSKRGYTADQVLAELELREPDSRDFIRPQREFADIVVQFHPRDGV